MDDNGPNESNVKVAVRVRPMNRRGRCTFHVIVHFSVVGCSVPRYPSSQISTEQLGRAFKPSALAVSVLQHRYKNILFAPALGMFWQRYRGSGTGRER